MTAREPKWNRRKDDRPAEIISAAINVFAEKGFAAAKLDDVAKRAGIAKGTLYRYFETKDEMFRAVVREALAANLQAVEQASLVFEGTLGECVPMLLSRAADRLGDPRFPAIARMVFTESRTFPDLASVWHDELVTRMLVLIEGAISKAQARGEVRPGDPKLYAFSILGPIVTAVLFHEVFGSSRSSSPDLQQLATQHSATVLRGMLISPQN